MADKELRSLTALTAVPTTAKGFFIADTDGSIQPVTRAGVLAWLTSAPEFTNAVQALIGSGVDTPPVTADGKFVFTVTNTAVSGVRAKIDAWLLRSGTYLPPNVLDQYQLTQDTQTIMVDINSAWGNIADGNTVLHIRAQYPADYNIYLTSLTANGITLPVSGNRLQEYYEQDISIPSASGGGSETLPAITVSPSSPTFVAGAAAGTSIATLSAVPSGATRTISGDGRVVLDSAKTALVVGLTAATAGTTVSVTVTDTKAGATNSPVSATISISVTASGTVTRYLATNMAEATMPNTQPAGSGGNELTRVRTFYLPVAMDDLEFTFSNTTVNADGTVTGAPAFTAFGASLRLASSSAAPVQGSFSGSTEIALASGAQATCVFTGPFAAGLYEYRAYTKKTDSTAFRGSYATASWYSSGGWLAGKHLTDATVDLGNTNAAPFTPIAIKGKPSSSAKPVSFLLYGDSIATGFYDSSNSADRNGDLGGFSKGITAAGAAHARFTTPSMSMRTAASTACRAALLAQLQAAKPDYILDQMGVNDFYQDAVSLAEYQTRKNAFWDWCVTNGYSGKVIATTVTPSNGTADAARQSANTWLLTKPHAALAAVWDVAAAMTGSTTGSAYTSGLSDDALHPNSTGHNTLKTFIQGKAAALSSGGGTSTPEVAGGWDAASAVNGATVSGAVATLAYDGPSGIFAAKRINPGEKKIFVMRVDEYAEDGSLGLIQQGANLARFTDGFAGVPGFLLAPFRGTNYINGVQHQSFSGLNYDASVIEIWADRTTSGLLKIWWKFADNGYNYGDRSDAGHQGANPITGSSPIEIPVNDSVVLVPVAQNGYGHASPGCHYTLNETAASFADVIATIPNGWTSWAGGTGGASTGGSTSSSDTSGGTSYVTPSGAGDGADGTYDFGTTAIADPVAARSRLRIATTPLKAGSGDTETFWAHDYFSTQGINVNLMEDVNRHRINFVTGFLKHLRPALIRVALTSTDTNIINMYKALCDAVGCKMVFQGMSFNDYSESTMAQKAAACVARVKALGGSEYIAWLEGMNEVDLNLWRFGAANNATAISMMVDMHTKCYDALKADAATSGILIAAPSCTGTNGQISTDVNTAIKGMSSKYDAGNARWYSGKWEPNMPAGGVDGNGYGTVEYELAKARATANGKVPVVITECGYHNAILNVTDAAPHLPVREDTASLYFPDIFTLPYMKGARVVTSYQVSDFSTSGALQTDKRIDQENFGMLRYGARGVKPGGITMARYNAKLRDDTAAPTMAAIPAYTMGNATNVVRRNFMKSNGQYLIAMRDGRRAVDVDTEKWSGGRRTAPFNPNALLIYPEYTATINFGTKSWSKAEWYNVHLDTTTVLTKDGSGNYNIPMSQKTGLLILTP